MTRLVPSVKELKFRVRWPWQATGRHYKLMLLTSVLAAVVVAVSWLVHEYVAAAATMLFILTLTVQWLCIEPPDVTEKDLH